MEKHDRRRTHGGKADIEDLTRQDGDAEKRRNHRHEAVENALAQHERAHGGVGHRKQKHRALVEIEAVASAGGAALKREDAPAAAEQDMSRQKASTPFPGVGSRYLHLARTACQKHVDRVQAQHQQRPGEDVDIRIEIEADGGDDSNNERRHQCRLQTGADMDGEHIAIKRKIAIGRRLQSITGRTDSLRDSLVAVAARAIDDILVG